MMPVPFLAKSAPSVSAHGPLRYEGPAAAAVGPATDSTLSCKSEKTDT